MPLSDDEELELLELEKEKAMASQKPSDREDRREVGGGISFAPKKGGFLTSIGEELLSGHAPNAVEPTTAAQIMAPAVMGGGGEAVNAVRHGAHVASGLLGKIAPYAKTALGGTAGYALGKRLGLLP